MAGLIIGVTGKKGGSGKTTVAVNVAGALAEIFTEVLVIDSDPQGTVLTWRAAAGNSDFPVQVMGLPQPVIHQEAPKFAQKYDAVVIDSPSGYQDEQIQRSVMLAASLVVIPVQPSAVDIWSARDTAALVEQAKLYNPDLKAHLLISRAQPRTRLSQEAREALEGLSLPVFQTTISQRISLAEAPLYGKLILHYANNPAAAEFRSLAREILEVVHHGKEVS
ncbi:MAG TPA: ParA family partition ATPase [Gammaproteobacteria bacterium]|jgi:chromosome partitioning protein|nr:ParA family partition ATPase [Gammaproteobacteria bacterium]